MTQQTNKCYFQQQLVIVGFGSIGKAVLPLLFEHFTLKPSNVIIITEKDEGRAMAEEFGVVFCVNALTPENYTALLGKFLKNGDFLLNLSVNVSSAALIEFCQQQGSLYLDTCTEPWKGGYTDPALPLSSRTNYMLREQVLALKNNKGPTAVMTHGANPGLVSHFVKKALLNIAEDNGLSITTPTIAQEWALLAQQLGIKTIHIAERDTQIASMHKTPDEFVNTWSVDGFQSEGMQPAELGWGTHERHWPDDAHQHEVGSKAAVYLARPGAATRVRTWAPNVGATNGFLIPHAEAISIAAYLTIYNANSAALKYRPTVHYAYTPCPDALLSLHEFASNEYQRQKGQRILVDEVIDGMDHLGVLLMGNVKGAYWYGSELSIHEARNIATHNNATSMQVAAGVLTGMQWAIQNPLSGIVEPEDLDHDFVLAVARPYLGKVSGMYTDWTPLQNREKLFKEILDNTDPWQFINIRVV